MRKGDTYAKNGYTYAKDIEKNKKKFIMRLGIKSIQKDKNPDLKYIFVERIHKYLLKKKKENTK